MKQMNVWELVGGVLKGSQRTLLYGPPGTGKSTAGQHWAKDNGWKIYSLTLTEETSATLLWGHFISKGGDFVWHDGVVARAWRESQKAEVKGVLVILNEIDHSSGDVQTGLHVALDDEEIAQNTMPTGETLQPKAGKVRFLATMNGVPESLPLALRDRFPVRIHITETHPEAISALPKELQTIARNTSSISDEERRVSIRAYIEYAKLSKVIGEQQAATAVFGARAEEFLNAIRIAAR